MLMESNTFNIYVETVDTKEPVLFRKGVDTLNLDKALYELSDTYLYITNVIVKITFFDE